MRYAILVDDTEDEIDGGIFVLQGFGFTLEQIEQKRMMLLVGRKPGGTEPLPPPQQPKWWESLPPAPARTPIRARVTTILYKDRTRTVAHSTKQPGETVEYWGRHEDGWLVVYAGPTFTLWGFGEDFGPM